MFRFTYSWMLYVGFAGLYIFSLTEVWVVRGFIVDELMTDGGVGSYHILYQPVLVLGIIILAEWLFLMGNEWLKRICYGSHVILGIASLAYCVYVWNYVNQSFVPFSSQSLRAQFASLGPGYFIFVSASVLLIVAGLCAMRECGNEKQLREENRE